MYTWRNRDRVKSVLSRWRKKRGQYQIEASNYMYSCIDRSVINVIYRYKKRILVYAFERNCMLKISTSGWLPSWPYVAQLFIFKRQDKMEDKIHRFQIIMYPLNLLGLPLDYYEDFMDALLSPLNTTVVSKLLWSWQFHLP